jgi:hypothetical protein
MVDPLEAVLTYKMNELETKAYKISLMWVDLTTRMFPNYQHVKLRKSGDPRKSLLFKHCYKLARETLGLVEDKDYELYITAQLQIMKHITDGAVHALIDPCILHGEKAWKRWAMWKKQYNRAMDRAATSEEKGADKANPSLVRFDLADTRKFLIGKLGEKYTKKDLADLLEDRTLIGWTTLGKISPFYLVLSPWLVGVLKMEEFSIDLNVYKEQSSDELETVFREMFPNETTTP